MAWDDENFYSGAFTGEDGRRGSPRLLAESKKKKVGQRFFLAGALDLLDSEGEPVKVPLELPAGMKRPLLLLFPDKTTPSGLRSIFLEDNRSTFPWGSMRIINTTGEKRVFRLEGKLYRVSDSWTPLEISPGGANRNFEVAIYLPDKPKRPIYSAIWEYGKELRQLCFVAKQDNPSLGPIKVKVVPENRKILEAEKKAGAE